MEKTALIHNTLRHKGTALSRVINDIDGIIYQINVDWPSLTVKLGKVLEEI